VNLGFAESRCSIPAVHIMSPTSAASSELAHARLERSLTSIAMWDPDWEAANTQCVDRMHTSLMLL
jgi:hypothetical protein